ncbi:corrinoid protein [Parasporobacterium paucivorans]|uniref:Methylmalonyl-CoA mutase C-terminal domain-containing protein n=1 Tax=Parasporobacterium paucivorans DSM 15970 TaxID=1122934 RepID=A0A1M6BX40_9FIRM|nr:corrinoid protein [Parasporobacterium paucivorans]SHI53237.1 methylmalonyl-CoA mutase C-terminal domain-containing protein [Parasporobacterium paucivorans DSM 15970]
MSKLNEIAVAVDTGKSKVIGALVQEAINEGIDPKDILNIGMLDAMAVVGEKFKNHVYFVPEMMVAARAMKKGLEVLRPHLAAENAKKLGKMVMGTVAGDLHDIGKNLVIMMIESVGFEVVDLGVDVPVEKFLEAASDPDVDIVGLSTLLTTTMPALEEAVKALNALPNRSQFKIMVGGAPVTQDYATFVGADGYSMDAVSAADLAKTYVA